MSMSTLLLSSSVAVRAPPCLLLLPLCPSCNSAAGGATATGAIVANLGASACQASKVIVSLWPLESNDVDVAAVEGPSNMLPPLCVQCMTILSLNIYKHAYVYMVALSVCCRFQRRGIDSRVKIQVCTPWLPNCNVTSFCACVRVICAHARVNKKESCIQFEYGREFLFWREI